MTKFIAYLKCSTCIKAKKKLESLDIDYQLQDIKEDNPTKQQLEKWIELSCLNNKKFFNTSGNVYKELQLKDQIKTLTFEEKINLLSSNGMLVKRPILVMDDKVVVGYKEEIYDGLVA